MTPKEDKNLEDLEEVSGGTDAGVPFHDRNSYGACHRN